MLKRSHFVTEPNSYHNWLCSIDHPTACFTKLSVKQREDSWWVIWRNWKSSSKPICYCKYIGWCSNISNAVSKKLTNIWKLFQNSIHAIQKLENADRIDIVWVVYNQCSDQRKENHEESGAFIKVTQCPSLQAIGKRTAWKTWDFRMSPIHSLYFKYTYAFEVQERCVSLLYE